MGNSRSYVFSTMERFSPFDWCNGPLSAVFVRELIVALRHRRYALLLVGLSGMLLFAIAINFARMLAQTIPTAELVTNVVGLQCSALLLILFFVIPALGAVTIATERFQETDELLRMAVEDRFSLVLGKLFAMLALFTIFQIALLPFSVFTYFFAGIEVQSFFKITFMLYGTACCHSVMGMSVSHVIPHPGRSLFCTFAFLILIYGLPSAYTDQLLTTVAVGGQPLSWYFNPLPLLRDLLHSIAGWTDCFRFLGFQIGATFVVMAASLVIRALRPYLNFKISLLGLTPSLSRPARPFLPVPDWANPAYHKDCMTTPLAGRRRTIVTGVGAFVGSLLLSYWLLQDGSSITPQEAYTLLLILLTPLLALEHCRREMDPVSLHMLRVTPMGSDKILRGKGLCLFRCLLPATVGVMVGGALIPVLQSLTGLGGGASDPQLPLSLVYQSALLPLKLGFFVVVSFACMRYRAPNATDLAFVLILATVLSGGAELIRSGLFDTAKWTTLSPLQLGVVYGAQAITATLAGTLTFVIALMRFEAVFDEGFDVYTAQQVDRSTH